MKKNLKYNIKNKNETAITRENHNSKKNYNLYGNKKDPEQPK